MGFDLIAMVVKLLNIELKAEGLRDGSENPFVRNEEKIGTNSPIIC
jgi:hypothetical protein